MTRCKDIERWVSAYVDGDLDERRASAVRGHLRSCAACLARVEDETRLRDAAEALETSVDPPPSLWTAIEARLAQEEVADSRRSRAWWWWQGARRHLLVGAAVAAALLIAIAWSARRAAKAPTEARPELAAVAEETDPATAITFAEQVSDEIARADARYQQTIAELRAIAADERVTWPLDAAEQFDTRLGELEAEVTRARAIAAGDRTPRSHDGLFAAYRTEIAFLSEAAVEQEAW